MDNLTIARRLKSIFFNDKTQYSYDGKGSLNRFGIPPNMGRRWSTPAEIALDIIKGLGYHTFYEVPDEGEQTNKE
jgi:hypothetical protein